MRKTTHDKISVILPKEKIADNLVARLMKIGEERERSINHLVIKAIEQYLEREEKK